MRGVIALNTISQFLGKIISAGTTFLITLLLARQFGVSGYGDFVKVTTYVAFFFLIADFGLNAIYLRKQNERQAFATLLGTRTILAGILIFFSVAILAFLPQEATDGYTAAVRLGIILFSPAILFQSFITTANAVFQKRLRYDIAAVALTAGSMCAIGVLWILLKTSAGPVFIGIMALLLGSAATSLFAFLGTKILKQEVTVSFSARTNLAFFIESVPLGLTLLFTLIYGHIDSVILTLTRSTAEVGIYGLAYKIFEMALVFPTFFMNALYPVLLTTKSHHERFITLLRRSALFLVGVSFLAMLVVWFAAPHVSNIQVGFAQSVTPLRILSLSFPFFFISALTMWALIALSKQLWLVVIYGSAMVINVFMNILFIPRFGYIAAAWTTVASEGIVLVVSGIVLLKLLNQHQSHNP